MRILYICGDLGVEVGGRKGAATHVRETCHALMRYGHEVLLITPSPGDRSQLCVPVSAVEPPRAKLLGNDGRYLLLNRRMGRAISRAIETFRPDAVYERYSLYQTAGQSLCRRHGIPRILEVNTLLAREQSHRLRLPGWAQRVEARLWRREKAIICVSTQLKRLMTQEAGLDESGMAGFIISPVAVDPARFHPDVPPFDFAACGIVGREVAGYMGTLTAWHGVDLFFEAARILRDEERPVVIAAVGGEPDRVDRLCARAREEGVDRNLFFLGSISHSLVPSYLAGVDVCLIPDTQDWSSPTKFFEFAAMQKPVVAAKSPAVEEVFGDGEQVGLLFERGNAADMVRKILAVLDDARMARRLGEAARRRILQHYTWSANIGRIMNLYALMGARGAVEPPTDTGDRPEPEAGS